jgi:hypothetical protein
MGSVFFFSVATAAVVNRVTFFFVAAGFLDSDFGGADVTAC